MLTRFLFFTAICGAASAQVAEQPPAPVQSLWLGDVNGDGRDDAFIVEPDGSTRLLLNMTDGTFEDVTVRSGLGETRGAHMAVFGDQNGDGRTDLYLPSWNGPSRLMLQAEEGTFFDATEDAGLPLHAEPIDASLRDVDGDGILDLWLTTAHDDLVFLSNGRGRFEALDLGITPRVGERPDSLDAARVNRGLEPIGAGGGNPAVGGPSTEPICAIYMQDQASPSVCLLASSDPTLGMLYPISSEWFVDSSSGFVGLGTTSPSQRLHVAGNARVDGTVIVAGGGAPFQISSTTLVANLNADLLDGLDASAFAQLPVDGGDIADGSIGSADIQDNSLTANDLAANSVSTSELANSSVTGAKILDSTITSADIANAAVGTSALANFSVTGAKILDGTITSSDMANGAIGTAALANSSVTGAKVQDSSLTAADLASSSVGSSELASDSVNGSKVLDGSLTSADLAPGTIGNGQLAAGAVFDVNVNPLAAVQGSKIVPDFGTQAVGSTGSASFGNSTTPAWSVKGSGSFGPTFGFLGTQGTDDYEGVASADWLGYEIGSAGISTGTSTGDNFGLMGHSNGIGVRGEHAGNPTLNFGELGLDGIGVYASGTTYAGQFDGRVIATGVVNDSMLEVTNSASSGTAGEFEITNSSSNGTSLLVKNQGTGSSLSLSHSNTTAIPAAAFLTSVSTNASHRTLHVVNQAAGSAQAAFIDLNNVNSSGTSAWIRNRGTGTALLVETENSPLRTMQVQKLDYAHNSNADIIEVRVNEFSADSGQFIEFERDVDGIKFRVDVDGDVFADGAYTGPADFAEMLRVSTGAESSEPGDVVSIDPDDFRSVKVSSQPYSRLVAGVYSTKPGFVGSEREFVGAIGPNGESIALKRSDMAELYDEVPIAVVGIVPCKISLENGPVRPGDLLVTSSTPGHAMVDNDPPVGTVVGKSLEAFDGSKGRTGVIKILVTLQ